MQKTESLTAHQASVIAFLVKHPDYIEQAHLECPPAFFDDRQRIVYNILPHIYDKNKEFTWDDVKAEALKHAKSITQVETTLGQIERFLNYDINFHYHLTAIIQAQAVEEIKQTLSRIRSQLYKDQVDFQLLEAQFDKCIRLCKTPTSSFKFIQLEVFHQENALFDAIVDVRGKRYRIPSIQQTTLLDKKKFQNKMFVFVKEYIDLPYSPMMWISLINKKMEDAIYIYSDKGRQNIETYDDHTKQLIEYAINHDISIVHDPSSFTEGNKLYHKNKVYIPEKLIMRKLQQLVVPKYVYPRIGKIMTTNLGFYKLSELNGLSETIGSIGEVWIRDLKPDEKIPGETNILLDEDDTNDNYNKGNLLI